MDNPPLTRPRIYLIRMAVFLVLAGFVAFILYRQIWNAFLANPRGFLPGTSMTFAGLPRGSERADVITFLNSKSDSPAPLPKAAEAPSSGPKTQ